MNYLQTGFETNRECSGIGFVQVFPVTISYVGCGVKLHAGAGPLTYSLAANNETQSLTTVATSSHFVSLLRPTSRNGAAPAFDGVIWRGAFDQCTPSWP